MTLVKGLTSNNTSKKKLKFSSSEEKRQYLEYQKWKEELKSSLKPKSKPNRLKADYSFVRETKHIPSLITNEVSVASKKETRKYEGERKLIGISTLHKSNMVPVFDEEYAKDIAKMRR